MRSLSDLEKMVLALLLKKEKRYALRAGTILRNALNQIRAEMALIYDKYAVDGKLTKAVMTQYNRYATMESQMLGILNPALRATLTEIKRLTPEQYEASFVGYSWAIDNATGVRLGWGILNMDTVVEALASDYLKISLERYGLEARLALRAVLVDGISLGKSYPQMIAALKKTINTAYWKLLRILRTEGQTAINAGQNDSYIRALAEGINGKIIWDATLDARTRETHGHMDGKEKQPDGLFNGPGRERALYPGWEGLSAGERINCRCRERLEIDGYEPQLRRTRDQGIIPYQTYDDWIKTYGPIVRK